MQHNTFWVQREIASFLLEGSAQHSTRTCSSRISCGCVTECITMWSHSTIRCGCITMRSTLMMIYMNWPDIEPVDEVKAQLLESVQNLGQILESVQNLGQMVYQAYPANPLLALFHRKLMSLAVKYLGTLCKQQRLGEREREKIAHSYASLICLFLQ